MPKISALPAVADLTGDETVVLVKDGETRRGPIGGLVDAAVEPSLTAMALSLAAAQLARDQAADLVDNANIFIDIPLATAEAAVAAGISFKLVSSATGLADVRRRTPGGSELLYQEATKAALEGMLGASFLGTDDGRNVQQRIDELKNGAMPAVAVGAASMSIADFLTKSGVRPEHALAEGESISVDAAPAMRRILAAGRPLILSRNTEYVVGFDPASAFDDGGTTRYSACISLGSNAHILAEAGSTIKGANGLQSWTRIVSAVGANKIVILGVLRVDGNVANKGAAHNEHMHGVFLFDCTEFYIEAIDSRNTRGDNVYIGGTDNSTGCANSFIGRIIGRTAGRKNLACQAFNACHIGSADLDNTSGGIGAYMPAPSVGLSVPKSAGVYASDTGFPMLNTTGAAIVLTGTSQASLAGQGFIVDQTDKHCLDVEPDAFSGATRNQMRIDYVRARGSGVDFTAGTTFTQANAMVVNFGEIDMAVVPSPGVPVWVQNAITINVGVLSINGLTPTCPTSPIYYAARLNVGRMVVNGASPPGGYAFLVSQVGNNVPRIEIGTIDGVITGSGFEVRDSDFEIGNCRVTCSAVTFWARGLSSTAGVEVRCIIKRLELDNSGDPAGANYAGLLTKSGSNIARLDIDHVVFRDSRATKLARIIYCQTGAARGLSIGRQDNETTVATVAWEGTDKFYRTNGGGTAPATFVCNGTPEGMVAAPIGSLAYRNDGGASTSIYVKESGTGNTGWVAK